MDAVVQLRTTDSLARSAEEKQRCLLESLRRCESLLVALSGGADSAYLAWAANGALGSRALAITALSPSFSKYDRERVEEFVRTVSMPHEFVETHELENPAYQANRPDRCYHCKDELFSVLDQLAQERGFAAVAYGVNADDTLDWMPACRSLRFVCFRRWRAYRRGTALPPPAWPPDCRMERK